MFDGASILPHISSNNGTMQVYNKDSNAFVPDWSAAPNLVLTPSLSVSGQTGDQLIGSNIKAGTAQWKKDGVPVVADATHLIGATAPFPLTVKVNELAGKSQVIYEFSAIYIDQNNKAEVPFSVNVTFSKAENPGALVQVLVNTPDGNVFKNGNVQSLRIHSDFMRGNVMDATNVVYKWGIQDAGIFAPTTATAAGAVGAKNLVLASISNVIIGSKLLIAGSTYTVDGVTTGTKTVSFTPGLSAATAAGVAVTCPYYDGDLGVGWGYITSTNNFGGITNPTTNEITVPAAAVVNQEVFKCAVKDTDSGSSTYNKVVYGFVSIADYSDPITCTPTCLAGNVWKNGVGDNKTYTAVVWQAGKEIDVSGSLYSYQWVMYDEKGNTIPAFNKTGKTITVTPSDTPGKCRLECILADK